MMEAVVGNGFNLNVIVDAISEVAPSAIHWGDCGPSTTHLHNLHQSLNFGIASIPHSFDSHGSSVLLVCEVLHGRLPASDPSLWCDILLSILNLS